MVRVPAVTRPAILVPLWDEELLAGSDVDLVAVHVSTYEPSTTRNHSLNSLEVLGADERS